MLVTVAIGVRSVVGDWQLAPGTVLTGTPRPSGSGEGWERPVRLGEAWT